jgi:hypothetical protein
MTTFNGVLQSHTYDQGAADLERANRDYRAQMDRQERCEAWMVAKLAGLTFYSYDALVDAAVKHFERVRGTELTEDEARLIANAARAVWGGLAERALCRLTIGETGRVESITIRSAA